MIFKSVLYKILWDSQLGRYGYFWGLWADLWGVGQGICLGFVFLYLRGDFNVILFYLIYFCFL